MSSTRRSARISALQILYPLALGDGSAGFNADQAIAQFWQHFEAPEEARTYAERLVKGVVAQLCEIDKALEAAAKNWRLERMARVDLTILRLGAYELLFEFEVPHEVVIDEAVELTKQFSTTEASSFVNGVLAPLVGERKVRQ